MSEARGGRSRLAVTIDGAALDDEAARALWVEFSAHMDANQGDFDGFAKKKGWVSVAPEHRAGQAVLVARTTDAPPAPPAPAPPRTPRGQRHKSRRRR